MKKSIAIIISVSLIGSSGIWGHVPKVHVPRRTGGTCPRTGFLAPPGAQEHIFKLNTMESNAINVTAKDGEIFTFRYRIVDDTYEDGFKWMLVSAYVRNTMVGYAHAMLYPGQDEIMIDNSRPLEDLLRNPGYTQADFDRLASSPFSEEGIKVYDAVRHAYSGIGSMLMYRVALTARDLGFAKLRVKTFGYAQGFFERIGYSRQQWQIDLTDAAHFRHQPEIKRRSVRVSITDVLRSL